jgi:hypothetical protein
MATSEELAQIDISKEVRAHTFPAAQRTPGARRFV